jgi:hypothetical protein
MRAVLAIALVLTLDACAASTPARPLPTVWPADPYASLWRLPTQEQIVRLGQRARSSVVVTPAAAAAHEVVTLDVDDVAWPLQASVMARMCRLDLDASLAGPLVLDRRARVTLDASGEELREVLRRICAQADLSLVLGSDVAGVVTLSIGDRPWPEALASVRDAGGVHVRARDGVVLVTRSSTTWGDDDLHRAAAPGESLFGSDDRVSLFAVGEPLGRVGPRIKVAVSPEVALLEVTLALHDVPRDVAARALALSAGCSAERAREGLHLVATPRVSLSAVDRPVGEVLRRIDDTIDIDLTGDAVGRVSVDARGAPRRALFDAIAAASGPSGTSRGEDLDRRERYFDDEQGPR